MGQTGGLIKAGSAHPARMGSLWAIQRRRKGKSRECGTFPIRQPARAMFCLKRAF